MCTPSIPAYVERQETQLMIWNGRKAIFSCDHCEKCECTEISQIRFKGDDKFEIYIDAFHLPTSGTIVMRCKDHRVSNDHIEVDTIYHPNFTGIDYGWDYRGAGRTIQAPPIAENVISHNPLRDQIILDQNDFAWKSIK